MKQHMIIIIRWLNNKCFSLTGYKIIKAQKPKALEKPRDPETRFPETTMHFVLMGLLAAKKKLKILQIGANDGRVNDPIYGFSQQFIDRTDLILLEPQPDVAKRLVANYEKHPTANIIVKAIGDGNPITLYSVKPEIWRSFNVHYAENWPEGRAATGVASSKHKHVLDWVKKHGNLDHESADNAIAYNTYETITVEQILRIFPEFCHLDVLQVDIEGSDHYAVHAALDAGLRPSVINFESVNLVQEDLETCLKALERSGYACFTTDMDTICIRLH